MSLMVCLVQCGRLEEYPPPSWLSGCSATFVSPTLPTHAAWRTDTRCIPAKKETVSPSCFTRHACAITHWEAARGAANRESWMESIPKLWPTRSVGVSLAREWLRLASSPSHMYTESGPLVSVGNGGLLTHLIRGSLYPVLACISSCRLLGVAESTRDSFPLSWLFDELMLDGQRLFTPCFTHAVADAFSSIV